MFILEAQEVSKTYPVDQRRIKVLENISLGVAPGEFVVVTGRSGSGKTTLLTLLSGLDHPSSGRIILDGRDITHAPERQLASLRNQMIGFVFQSFHLIPSMTALENVMFPAELLGNGQARQKALDLLERIGLAERAQNLPSQLSGGEKQRVALCRAMVNSPRLLFADEPTGNLDSQNGRAVIEELLQLKNETRATLVMVTHNPDIARMADRIFLLQDGRLSQEQTVAQSSETASLKEA
jgi:putative ABC transport system ATP-binding protein